MALKRIKYNGQEYLPVKYDLVFKAVFTTGGDMVLLASLLSCILELDIRAEDITISNTELPKAFEDGKVSRVDVRIKLADGKHLNCEIQLKNKRNIEKRSVFYTAKLYTDQMKSGMKFNELCPAIAINILDFPFLPYKEYHNRYRLKNTKNNEELTDVTEDGEVLEMLKNENPIMEKAVNKLHYFSADEQLRYELDMREKAEFDYYDEIATARDEGIEQEKLAIVKKLLKRGRPIDEIIEDTGLTRKELESIKLGN